LCGSLLQATRRSVRPIFLYNDIVVNQSSLA